MSAETIVDEVLRGPRGRRMCLSYLMSADPDVSTAVIWTAREPAATLWTVRV